MTPPGIIEDKVLKDLGVTDEDRKAILESSGCGGCVFLSLLLLVLTVYFGGSFLDYVFGLFSQYTGG